MRPLRTAVLLAAAALAGSALIAPSPASAVAAAPAAGVTPLAAVSSGLYHAVTPSRILDTRSTSPVGPAQTRNLAFAGHGGVPATGAGAVVFNLTVTGGTSPLGGFVTAFPQGQTRPTASTINYAKGWTGANLATVALPASGQLSFYNSGGSVQVIVDVVGWYSDGVNNSAGGQFYPVTPARLVDTRPGSPLGGKGTLTDPMTFTNGTVTADAHVTAVAVNITVTGPQATGYVTAWSGVGAAPTASVLDFTAGKTVSNLVVLPVSPCTVCTGSAHNLPSIKVLNSSAGNADILIDIWGFYDDGSALLAGGNYFKPLSAPTRILDTRSGFGGATTFAPGTAKAISNTAGVSDANTAMLVQNVTALPSTSGYITLWPTGQNRPVVSNMNPIGKAILATLSYTGLGTLNHFDIYNSAGNTNIVVDVAGSFESGTSAAMAPAVRAAAASSPAWTASSSATPAVSTR